MLLRLRRLFFAELDAQPDPVCTETQSMLVLSRKLHEEVVIAGTIRVRVLEIQRGRVRLGFSAPDNVRIQRAELVVSGDPLPPDNSDPESVAA